MGGGNKSKTYSNKKKLKKEKQGKQKKKKTFFSFLLSKPQNVYIRHFYPNRLFLIKNSSPITSSDTSSASQH